MEGAPGAPSAPAGGVLVANPGPPQHHTELYQCAVCRARIVITSQDVPERTGGLFDASRIEESFVVLDGTRGAGTGQQGGPTIAAHAPSAHAPTHQHHQHHVQQQQQHRGLDESFVLLPQGASGGIHRPGALQSGASPPPIQQQQQHAGGSPLQQPSATAATNQAPTSGAALDSTSGNLLAQGAPAGTPPPSAQQQQQAPAGLDAKLQALSHLFELAATSTQLDHPLCLDCYAQLKDEVETQVKEAEREIESYSEAVRQLEADLASHAPLPKAAFEAEVARLREAQEEQRRASLEAELQLEAARRELQALQSASGDLDALEDKYWHDHNAFLSRLKSHVEERDALLVRMAHVSQRKQLLLATNVYNDAFKIWHDGPFATISGFRLGRTPEVPVEWDEINAAWGQAVLLLHTMATSCGISFSAARLIPMGSHPRVADRKATYDLFGPVNKLWSSNYDRAMIIYLQCLSEFGEYANTMDANLPGGRTFDGFPFPIDGDKVNGYTIKLTLNKDAKWTKALKFMLADLKKALQWTVKYDALMREADMQKRMAGTLQAEPLHHHSL